MFSTRIFDFQASRFALSSYAARLLRAGTRVIAGLPDSPRYKRYGVELQRCTVQAMAPAAGVCGDGGERAGQCTAT